MVLPVELKFPRLNVVFQITEQSLANHALPKSLVENRKAGFNTLEKVSLHPVRAGAVDNGVAPILEIEYPAVLEEPADDGDDPDIIRVEPYSICWMSRATRASKNSSRLKLAMHKNFSRSSSGVAGSRDCSKTRRWNARRLSSRLM